MFIYDKKIENIKLYGNFLFSFDYFIIRMKYLNFNFIGLLGIIKIKIY